MGCHPSQGVVAHPVPGCRPVRDRAAIVAAPSARTRLTALIVALAALATIAMPSDAAPITEHRKLVAPDGDFGDIFGSAVATSRDRLVIGAMFDEAAGPFRSGSAYLYDSSGTLLGRLTAPDPQVGAEFGVAVAVDESVVVVGADNESTAVAEQRGAAYLFDHDGELIAKLTAPDGMAMDHFGRSVAVGDGVVAVGAIDSDLNGPSAGAVYLFDYAGNHLRTLVDDVGSSTGFGRGLALDGDRLVIGAYPIDRAVGGVAYVTDLRGTRLATLLPPDPQANSSFGTTMAMASGRVLVGASWADEGSGSAYLFDAAGSWLRTLKAPDADQNDFFGSAVALMGNLAVIGAPGDSNDVGWDAGSIYVADLGTSAITKIVGSDTRDGDLFGGALAARDSHLLVGAQSARPSGQNSGAAYLFDLTPTSCSDTANPSRDEVGLVSGPAHGMEGHLGPFSTPVHATSCDLIVPAGG